VRTIDLENHFVPQTYIDALYRHEGYPRLVDDPSTGKRRLYYAADTFGPHGDVVMNRLLDFKSRIKEMDATDIDVAVISLTSPGVDQFEPKLGTELARQANDALAEAVDAHPGRIEGFAAACPHDPDAAAKELERAVKELGFLGWKTHSNFGSSYLDDRRYWPILEMAEKLDAPIYLHPTAPAIPAFRTYGFALAGAAFGFGAETALAMMRLILSGAFDAFPKLKIILGHYGEGLPFLLQRVDSPFVRPHAKEDKRAVPDIKRKPSDYLRDNMVVTTSGNYLDAAFQCTKDALGMDKIILGTDYPYEDMGEAKEFLNGLDLSDVEREQLFSRNVLGLGALYGESLVGTV